MFFSILFNSNIFVGTNVGAAFAGNILSEKISLFDCVLIQMNSYRELNSLLALLCELKKFNLFIACVSLQLSVERN